MREIDTTMTPEQYAAAEQDSRIRILRRSLDLRGGAKYHVKMLCFEPGETVTPIDYSSPYRDCHDETPVVIVGAGPAGLFAALKALELGLKPVIVERGKPVGDRKKDIALLGRERKLDEDSNWCFGEGGAGTYSDGKLYTRSTKRGDTSEVIKKLIEHGADPKIAIDAHAHIGTDRLSPVIANIRNTIISHGGEFHFGCRVSDFIIRNDKVCGVVCLDGSRFEGSAVLLATGHSAREIYELFASKGWPLEAKPFALGVRVEHPQSLINSIQYHSRKPSPLLPPASYRLTAQASGHGVFSFCMCPGGVIVPAATAHGQQVVNGMSNSKRNSPFANSGIAVTVGLDDARQFASAGPLALLRFQQSVEAAMFSLGNDDLAAPAQRLTDFCDGRLSTSLNRSNYLGPTLSAPLHELLPPFVVQCLQEGFRLFDRKMRGFLTDQASILAVESRTSSPVRIPRSDDGRHILLRGLYPCGEGAGYAGGIVSSAVDGINAMSKIYNNIKLRSL